MQSGNMATTLAVISVLVNQTNKNKQKTNKKKTSQRKLDIRFLENKKLFSLVRNY